VPEQKHKDKNIHQSPIKTIKILLMTS